MSSSSINEDMPVHIARYDDVLDAKLKAGEATVASMKAAAILSLEMSAFVVPPKIALLRKDSNLNNSTTF
jgi:hypothetical protein